jgi:lysozyme
MPAPSPKVLAGVASAALAIAGGLIVRWEGVRYTAYRDTGGILTVCYGHTGADVLQGKAYTQAECDAFLARDMAVANAAVKRCLPMPLLPQIEGALTSAVYNAGPKVVCGSTLQLAAQLNDWPRACSELTRWKYVGRSVSKGLENRRMDEAAVCLGASHV